MRSGGSLDFRIEILEQYWTPEMDPATDPCSHGRIRLTVGGQVIEPGEEEYGIAVSALALLRTLDSDHRQGHKVADRLILHGCAQLLMQHCPIGIDWSVRHAADRTVFISDIVRYPTTRESAAVRYPDVSIRLAEPFYRSQVLPFAQKAKALFLGAQKTFDSDVEQEYGSFWEEYDQRLTRASESRGE